MFIFFKYQISEVFLCQSVQFLSKVWARLAFYQKLACLGKIKIIRLFTMLSLKQQFIIVLADSVKCFPTKFTKCR